MGERCLAGTYRIALIAGALILGGASAPWEAGSDTGSGLRSVGPGQVIVGELAPGETHVYALQLPPQQFVQLVAEQRGVDLVLSLEVQETVVAEVNGPGGRWIEETLVAITGRGGRYLVRIRAVSPVAGSYELRVEEIRDTVADDRLRVAATSAMHQARHLWQLPSKKKKEEALAVLEASLSQWTELGDIAGEARARHQLGKFYRKLRGDHQALELFRQALSLRKETRDICGQAEALDYIGVSLRWLGKMERARDASFRSVELARQCDDRVLVSALIDLAVYLRETGDPEQAGGLYREALTLARAAELVRDERVILSNHAVIFQDRGDTEQALEYYQQALQLARELEDPGAEGNVLNKMGLAYRARGEMQQALASMSRARQIARDLGDLRLEAGATLNLGYCFSILGEQKRAQDLFSRALVLFQKLQSPRWEAWSYIHIAWLHESHGRSTEALDSFRLALTKSREAEDGRAEGYALHGMGRVRQQLGQPAKALNRFRQALAIQDDEGNLVGKLSSLRDIGAAYLALGKLERADEVLDTALDLSMKLRDSNRKLSVLSVLSRLEYARGHLLQANNQSKRVLDALDTLRMGVSSPEFRATFLSRQHDEFARAVNIKMRLHQTSPDHGYDHEAYVVAEKARARSLLELLYEAKVDVEAGIDPKLLERRRRATERLTWLQLELPKVMALAEQDELRINGLQRELDQVKQEMEQIEWTIRTEHEQYDQLRYPESLDVAQVQEHLDDQSALLQYVLGDEVSYLFMITSSEFRVETLEPAGKILDLVGQARIALLTANHRMLDRYADLSRDIYELLVAPVAHRVAGFETLIIAPDRGLYNLPFEALVVAPAGPSPGARPSYLIERWNVIYVPSATVLATLRNNASIRTRAAGSCRKTFVAFADPVVAGQIAAPTVPAGQLAARSSGSKVRQWLRLPGSRREVKQIAELFDPKQVRLFLGPEATELASKQDDCISGSQWLHIACHGLVDEDQPAYSGLLLAKDEHGLEDGLLQVHEVFRLELQAEMVALSACETGLGKEIRGEGLVGLAQAFFYAGARSVVVSLWPVSDRSTEILMVRFYQGLKDGTETSAALRRAKLALLRNQETEHPYFWSPFILVGAAR